MSVGIRALLNAAMSHAMRIGHAERVLGHEPEDVPGHGLTIAVWPDQIRPVRSSGLASVSALVVLKIRLYGNVTQEPVDELDISMVDAVDDLLAAYAGDFDLGVANVRHVDIFGAEGVWLRAQAGYLDVALGVRRIVDIDLPLIINDVWDEVA